jgi:hypothetical protein|tara:strand:+ start:382 stop:624 length:243 start_codon:yes stop_codon:yes gene_type:complete
MSKKTNPFFLKKTISQLEELNDREQQLVLGIAKLTLYVHKKSNTAKETIQATYPNLRPHLKENVALALDALLEVVEPMYD